MVSMARGAIVRCRHIVLACVTAAVVGSGLAGTGYPQSEQTVEVVIKDFTFVTKQRALRLGVPTVITIKNEDRERHDFGSTMFDGIPTQIQTGGVIAYGRSVGGAFLDPQSSTTIRFSLERPGKHEFRCSIHPTMKGELLLLTVEAV